MKLQSMPQIIKYLIMIAGALLIVSCSTASVIQKAANSQSAFDNAVYDGEETILRDDIPDSEAFRVFHQGATGFVPQTAVKNSAEERAKEFCSSKGKQYELLRIRQSVGAQILGNFPRAELVFACLDVKEKSDDKDSSSKGKLYDNLRELKKLLDEGILTQEEFEVEKAKILDKSN